MTCMPQLCTLQLPVTRPLTSGCSAAQRAFDKLDDIVDRFHAAGDQPLDIETQVKNLINKYVAGEPWALPHPFSPA